MKKIFFVLFMTLLALPAFSFGFQTDAYFGSSSGFDAELVFGNGKFKNSVGILMDSHEVSKEEHEHTYSSHYGNEDYETKKVVTSDTFFVGPYYKLTFTTDFVKLRNIGLGMDISSFVSLGFDSVNNANIAVGFAPCAKISFNKMEVLAGWRATSFIADSMIYSENPFLQNAFTIGIRYSFRSAVNTDQNVDSSNDYNPSIRIIPGAKITNSFLY